MPSKPETLTATYRIVTPMFIGDASQKATGISPASVKGALRFWWRAINWGRIRSEAGVGSDEEGLKRLHAEEGRLFGVAASDHGGGQGCFRMIVQAISYSTKEQGSVHSGFQPTNTAMRNGRRNIDENHMAPARYLAYGLMVAFTSRDRETREIKKKAGQLERGCLDEGQNFTVKLLFRNQVDDTVLTAVKALGLLGGLGSRVRHGMGSISLESLNLNGKDIWSAPTSNSGYEIAIRKLFSSSPSSLTTEPPFSAFWKNSRIDLLLSKDDCYKVLDKYGEALLRYRSWGKRGVVLGAGSEKRFDNDHSWYKNARDPVTKKTWRDLHPAFHPERVEFGLPHNYGDQAWKKVNGETHNRRSSPLFFHVHQVGDTFIGVSIYLPAQFLPVEESINAGGTPVLANIKWSVITNFLDGKVGNPSTEQDRFPAPDKNAVLP